MAIVCSVQVLSQTKICIKFRAGTWKLNLNEMGYLESHTCMEAHLSMTLSTCLFPSTPP